VGDIDRDGNLDVVEGAPGFARTLEEVDIAGHVSYCPGTPDGPTSCRSIGKRAFHGAGNGSREAPASLAVGDVTGDGYADVLEGVPDDHYWSDPTRTPAGAVLLRRGTTRGPAKRPLRIDQATLGVPGTSEASDRFGTSVVVGHLDRDRYADIAIGAPSEDASIPSDPWAALSGRVTLLRGAVAGVRRDGAITYDRRTLGLKRKTGLGFGTALALLDHDGNGRPDLTIGSGGVWNDNEQAKGMLVTLLGRHRSLDARHAFRFDWTHLGVGPRRSTAFGTVIGH
jgi:hypothetical protein